MDYAERRGKEFGRKEGELKAKLEAAVIAVKKYNATLDNAAEDFGVSVESLKNALLNNS